jgi:hypothetical protein
VSEDAVYRQTVRVIPTSRLASRSAIASLKKQKKSPDAAAGNGKGLGMLTDGSDLEIRGLRQRPFNDRT